MPRVRIALLVLLLVPAAASAQGSPTAPEACAAPEHRQFDFWIGEWEVMLPNGRRAGTNRIQPILDGCVLQESWTGAGGMSGHSYNVYDRSRKVWHQTWVDGQGSLLQIEGRFANNRMILEGETLDSAGARVLNRITWTPMGPDRLRQLWETSKDGGKSWSVAFDGRYVKH
jgi:hypothetical protein